MWIQKFLDVAAFAAGAVLAGTAASAQITIPTVPIGNPGNAPDPFTGNLYGSVAYSYNIGTTEVTNAQYAAFLNAKAASDPFDLYDTDMAGFRGGIARSGSPGSYTYSTISGRANHPVTTLTFWDATRFVNWLHNGQGDGDTETGAYTLGGVANPVNASVTRNAGWQWALPSEDEWYKAAYHQPASAGGDSDNYWAFPTQSNAVTTTTQANIFGNGINNTRPVGSYAANYYGTFDMGGNMWEWNEGIAASSTHRVLRGGSYGGFGGSGWANRRNSNAPAGAFPDYGFRVVQVPGPSSLALLAIGGVMAARRRRGG